jgi:hypothetical protein
MDRIFFNSNSGGWSPTGSTRQVGHQLAYCSCPEWLWGWRIWCNDDWQGKPKYSEKTCPSATLSTTNITWPDRARTRAVAVGSRRLPAWAMARPDEQATIQITLLDFWIQILSNHITRFRNSGFNRLWRWTSRKQVQVLKDTRCASGYFS